MLHSPTGGNLLGPSTFLAGWLGTLTRMVPACVGGVGGCLAGFPRGGCLRGAACSVLLHGCMDDISEISGGLCRVGTVALLKALGAMVVRMLGLLESTWK